MSVFTVTANFQVPAGVTRIRIRCWGGGGGGTMGTLASLVAGNGGGGGAFGESTWTVVPGSILAVTVGAGGKGDTAALGATPGGDSNVVGPGQVMTCRGGAIGWRNSGIFSGNGGTLNGNIQFAVNGQSGAVGHNIPFANPIAMLGGDGGGSFGSSGGKFCTSLFNGKPPPAVVDGMTPGGGGCGGSHQTESFFIAGGGGAGLVLIEY